MGGRGSFSGLGKTIDDVLGVTSSSGEIKEIGVEQFHTLGQTEDMIRKRNDEVMVVFDGTGTAIKAYRGEKSSVAFPADEAKKWKGLTVTHNHPPGQAKFGGTFSFIDIRCATVYEYGSLRAVACGKGERNYILKAGKDARPMDLNRRVAKDIPRLHTEMEGAVEQVKREWKAGKYKDYGHAVHVAGQKALGVLNSYYREVAEQYGYTYRTQK